MLSDADIVQAVVGGTGSTTKLQGVPFDITLPTPCTEGNGIIIIAASDNQNVTKPTGFSDRLAAIAGVGTIAGGQAQFDWTKQAEGGEDTFTIDLIDADGCAVWCVLEVRGLESMVVDESGVPVALDERVLSAQSYGGGGVNVQSTGPGTGLSAGDALILACANTLQVSGVTPRTLSSVADTAGGGSGTWARPGGSTTIATSRGGSLANLRLDVYAKYPEGESHAIDATFTWATPPDPDVMSAMVLAYNAFWVPNQQTLGRAAGGSMTAF